MSLARSLRLAQPRNVQKVMVLVVLLIASAAIATFHRKPRVWLPEQTPVAFWAWRNQSPSEVDVRLALDETKAHAIFLRAGQIDIHDGNLRRIRPVIGSLPKQVDLHLVYNGTRSLLSQLERVDERALADAIIEAYRTDFERAAREHARVVGLQIDIDVPTRLLGRYEKMLRALRAQLKPSTQLSITGLPTWMESAQLQSTLAPVDFWIPQFYGSEIPERSDQLIPISSVESIASFVNQARELDKPFYAGLAAFSWTLLYSSSGQLISVRGDMDPEVIAADQNLELIDQRPFGSTDAAGRSSVSNEWRYGYRARADGVTDELAMHSGDVLVVDVPSAESLRMSARTVRELAGKKLLGVCVFRLPGENDPATLSVKQVAAAMADVDSTVEVEVRILPDLQPPVSQASASNWILEVTNAGTANATIGSAQIDLQVSTGQIESLTPKRSDLLQSLCAPAGATKTVGAQPCSQRRANVIRFRPNVLRAGQTVTARLAMNLSASKAIPVFIEMQTETGQPYRNRLEIIAESEANR